MNIQDEIRALNARAAAVEAKAAAAKQRADELNAYASALEDGGKAITVGSPLSGG